ncbi:RICIN domain-containing protein [Streptomyces netropsis]|uniref:RICIN domain-containing protein n=1 Tax=Streptomyces netropsis TaxID=55404 RepID=UPI0030D467C1
MRILPMKSVTLTPISRLIAFFVAVCCMALGFNMSPALTSEAHAEVDCGTLKCVPIFPGLNQSKSLDLENQSSSDSTRVVIYNNAITTPRPTQIWRLLFDESDATFRIQNTQTGKCIDKPDSADSNLKEYSCLGQASQKWYLQPWQPTGQPPGEWDGGYMIRHAEDNKCMDLLNSSQNDNSWVGLWNCQLSANQEWYLGNGPAWEEAMKYAASFGAKKCQANLSSCTWKNYQTSTPALSSNECVVTPAYFPNGGTVSLANTYETGWSDSLGGGFSVSLEAGFKFIAESKITTTLSVNYQHTWSGSEAVSKTYSFNVNPGNWGWITLDRWAVATTGDWTFDVGGFPWTVRDTVKVPQEVGPGGLPTVFVGHSESSFPGCTS